MDDSLNEVNAQDFVYALAAPVNAKGGLVLFAARQSGLYVSEDGGRTWRSAVASLNLEEPFAATCVAASPAFAEDRRLFVGLPGGVLLSEDGGQSWLSAQVPDSAPLPSVLVASPNFVRDQLLLLGTSEDGVLRSTNAGSSWSAWNFGLLDFNVLSLAFSPAFAEDQIAFAGTSSGLFISRNAGRAWRELPLPCDPAAVLSLAVSPKFTVDQRLYVGSEGQGMYCSQDCGKTWTRVGEGSLDGVVNQILISPEDPRDLLVAHENSLLRTVDGGKSWALLLEGDIACAAAPQGFTPGKLLVGLADGSVQII